MLTYKGWIAGREELARMLAGSGSPYAYADAVIPLCVSINAMASLLWVADTKNDKNRFTEIVAKLGCGEGVDTTTVSRPLLAQSSDAWDQAIGMGEIGWALTGDTDYAEATAILAHPDPSQPLEMKAKEVRKFSYGALLYSEIRCGFVHTYRTAELASSHDGSREIFKVDPLNVSYNNVPTPPDWRAFKREIFLPLDWIVRVAQNVADGMDAECEQRGGYFGENLGVEFPMAWWIDGA